METFTGLRADKASERLDYWISAGLIPKWYTYVQLFPFPHSPFQSQNNPANPSKRALTTLTTTPSFTPLSLTLLSLFSRLLHLTTALSLFTAHTAAIRAATLAAEAQERERKEREDEDEVVRVLEAFGREMDGEEVGVRVEREVEAPKTTTPPEAPSELGDRAGKPTRTPEPQARAKLKRKKKPAAKNAIDALFAGL